MRSFRALFAVLAILIGLALMALPYNRRGWFFDVLAVVGVALVLAAAIWWGISERRSSEQEDPVQRPGAEDKRR